jgi:uncharacterized protein YajQ (UPF0234 family)
MAQLASFDIVSDYDIQELKNALDQTEREISTRFDLKDTKTTIEHKGEELTINTNSEVTLHTVHDVLESKFVKRGLSLKILDYGKEEEASGGRVRQVVKLKKGIPDDLAKQINKRLRDEFKKVTPQIQGSAIRVQAKNRDDLQAVIAALKESDYPVALQFTNYR